MICSVGELQASLHQFSSFLDMLEALRLQAEETESTALFTHASKGPMSLLGERTADIRDFLQSQPNFLSASQNLLTDLTFFACLAEALIAAYRWSADRGQFVLYS